MAQKKVTVPNPVRPHDCTDDGSAERSRPSRPKLLGGEVPGSDGRSSEDARSWVRIGRADQALAFLSPAMCRSTSASLATPMKYHASISTVRLVGCVPVHRLISRQAMIAQ